MPIRPPVLAHDRFVERRAEFDGLTLEQRFEAVWKSNLWGADTSRSGLGSEAEATRLLQDRLRALLRDLDVKTLLDVPCGDYGWIGSADLGLASYVGGDIVKALIDDHQNRFATADGRVSFRHLDLCRDPLPRMDAILCRDCLVHLSFAHIALALDNIRRSSCRYMIATTFTEHDRNVDAEDGDWRMLNMDRAPFSLGTPLAMLNENCTEAGGGYADKSLGVWRIADLPHRSSRACYSLS